MRSFIITAASETARKANVDLLRAQLPDAELVEAVYPSLVHVPFLQRMMELSEQRTGKKLLPAEIGCLLSHRAVWRKILADADSDSDNHEHFLVLESDSVLSGDFGEVVSLPLQNFDLFFFGAWLGHMKLFRSTRKKINATYTIGTPFIKTVYCTYGYSLNKKAAAHLLKQTNTIAHPVDQFKYFVNSNEIRLGGIVPELISGGQMGSYINQDRFGSRKKKLLMHLLSVKNTFICFFK